MQNILSQIFADTQTQYSTNFRLIEACQKARLNHKFYGAKDEILCNKNRFESSAEIVVSKKRTFQAAEEYSKKGFRTAVLNFANSFNPGGGVVEGARAQEECLCRVSTLYDSISSKEMREKFYDPHCETFDDLATDDLIYTPEVIVFKSDTDEPAMLPENKWFSADVITCAAPCLGCDDDMISEKKLQQLHYSRAKHILDAACQNKVEVLILGAFGCGAFCNPPSVVAQVYKQVLSEYANAFKTIEFAIYCSSFETNNYKAFSKTFN